MTMKLYLDTEFTQLDWTAKLISIAVVDENEDVFYVELNDNYTVDDCSDFVKKNVLPHLLGHHSKMPYYEAAARLSQWISDRGVPCKFATDAPHWDMRLIEPLLEHIWPDNLSKDVSLVSIPYNYEQELFIKYDFTPHFAPHDALVNKRATCGK